MKDDISWIVDDEQPSDEQKISFNPLDKAYVDNPYPVLDELRKYEPVHRSDMGPWVITRYRDILAALNDVRLGNAPSAYAVINKSNREKYICADIANNTLAFMDPPDHTRPRILCSRAFHIHLTQNPPGGVA